MKSICNEFPILDEEYYELDKEFGKLCWTAAHELKRKNSLNNYIDDAEDVKQELIIDMMKAGSYTKRQIYIEKCFVVAKKYATDELMMDIIDSLEKLWVDRTRHGANRQKFGPFQEGLLEVLVRKMVPKKERPNKKETLKIDTKFATYCKAIVWNRQKSMGKKITREKSIRSGLVSLSEFDHIC